MEKKWWYLYGIQAQTLLILLCFVPLALARSAVSTETKKDGAAARKTLSAASANQTGVTKRKPLVKASSHSARRSATTLSAKKRVTSPKAQGKKKAKSALAKRQTKNGKKSRLAKSKRAAKSARSASKTQSARMTAASPGKGSPLKMGVAFSARREAITRNYEGIDAAAPYAPERAPFFIQVNSEPLFYRVNSLFTLPGESFTFSAGPAQKSSDYLFQSIHQALQTAPNTWSWKAPQKVGLYPMKIQPSQGGTPIQLNVFVMAPFSAVEDGYLNGYRIGHYPSAAYRPLSTHTLPRGFIEVTAENENTYVSPHFRLRQFLCKQDGEYPKYIALDARLLIVLEAILQKVNEQGHHSPTLSIMSAYRTPHYNRAIGNSTTYSRHLWGDAADIFVDAHPLDGEMDDLSGDKVIDAHDTEVLYDIVMELYEPRVKRLLSSSFFNGPILQQLVATSYADDARLQKLLIGGLARYRETRSHGPFVHVDVRGVFTRW